MRALRTLLTIASVVTGLWPFAPLAGEPPGGTGWLLPVDGPVIRPFNAPDTPYGPGHRGADLAAPPGTVVRAANDGVVSFAGTVAGTLHVVVAHDGNLRTSYAFLSRVDVHAGQAVRRGDPLGATGGTEPDHGPDGLHLGLRIGDRYIDPMQLFGPTDLTELVHLVPTDLPPARPWSLARERASLAEGLGFGSGGDGLVEQVAGGTVDIVTGAVNTVGRGTADVVDRLDDTGRRLVRDLAGAFAEVGKRTPAAHIARDLAEIAGRAHEWWESRGDCSGDSPPADGTGGSGHLLLAVAGINSQTGDDGTTFGLDADALGYYEGEVRFFSYAGDGGPYDKRDTWGDLLAAGRHLGDQLQAMHAANPGREVDLIAHSQGGVVVDVFLQHVYDAADPAYPPIGTVVTLASPHEGAPLASAAADVRDTRTGRVALDAADAALPLPPSDGTSTAQLAEDSELMRDLWRHRLPEHVDFTSIGGVDDVVVPATQIDVPDASEVVVDVGGLNDHAGIPSDPRALEVVRSALEGRAPPCIGVVEGLRGAIEPVVISRLEHTVGDVGGLAP